MESMDPENDVYFNFMDIVHFSTMVIVRVFVISTKYGFYSIEHSKIMTKLKID